MPKNFMLIIPILDQFIHHFALAFNEAPQMNLEFVPFRLTYRMAGFKLSKTKRN